MRLISANEDSEDTGKPWSSTFEGLRLEHHDLATAPPYLALSYVWGDNTDRVPVEIDGRSVPVTGNLCEALAHIWVFHDEVERGPTAVSAPVPDASDIKSDGSRSGSGADCQLVLYLRIDALCINQASFDHTDDNAGRGGERAGGDGERRWAVLGGAGVVCAAPGGCRGRGG